MAFPIRRALEAALWLPLLLLVACSSGSGAAVPAATTLESATERGAFGVGVTTFELIDTSRPTQANGDFAGADERTLTIEAWYPADLSGGTPEARDAELSADGAPYPLIVFAHGFSGNRHQSTAYTKHLASHGYVVIAPDFPLTNGGAPGGPRFGDLVNQPGDVSFIIDQLLSFNEEDGHLFEGVIDSEAIGLTGHSLGGFTTLLTVYGQNRDGRLRAALPISASGCFITDEMVGAISVPIMALTGSEDLVVAPAGNRRAYDLANAPRYWVELIGGNHIRFADFDVEDDIALAALDQIRGGDTAADDAAATDATPEGTFGSCLERPAGTGAPTIGLERQQELLRAFATPFFDAYLRDSEEAKQFLEQELADLVAEARFAFEAE